MIHSKARSILKQLELPSPLRKKSSSLKTVVDLSNNTNPFGGMWSSYSDISQIEIKQQYLKTIFGLNQRIDPSLPSHFLSTDQIQLTVGSIEGLDLVQRTFTDPGDTIVIPSPSFEGFQHWGLINSLTIETIPLQGENFETLDIDRIQRLSPKMVFICDPNNPTGTHLRPEIVPRLCESVSGFVVVDEAYIEFSERPSCIRYLKDFKNLIILRTLSKAWGLAGLRCGAVLSSDPYVIESLKYIQIPFGLSTPAQTQLRKKVGNMKALLESRQKIINNREMFLKKIKKSSQIEKIFSSHTNFICIVLKDFQKILRNFQKAGIKVADCSAVVPNAVRITVTTNPDMNKAAQLLI